MWGKGRTVLASIAIETGVAINAGARVTSAAIETIIVRSACVDAASLRKLVVRGAD